MLAQDRQFDVIYADSHHTFYVDLSAALEAHFLLKPGGYFLVDDIRWTLEFMKNNMLRQFHDWRFYRRMYDFSEYEPYQQNLPHIKMIVEQILIARLGYSRANSILIYGRNELY